MEQELSRFYDTWAEEQFRDPQRTQVLRWKAQTLARLCGQAGIALRGDVLEIGCAEGIVLDALRESYPDARYHGIDISATFIERGKRLFPGMELRCQAVEEFFHDRPYVDFVVLSDLLEHVPDDDALIVGITPHCGHLLLKVPLELNPYHCSRWLRALRRAFGKLTPPPAFGDVHEHRHLRGYSFSSLRVFLRRHGLRVLARRLRTAPSCVPLSRSEKLVSAFSEHLTVRLFGGSYFGVAATPRTARRDQPGSSPLERTDKAAQRGRGADRVRSGHR